MIGIGIWGFDETAVTTFRDAYWANKPKAVQALRTTPQSERLGLAVQLAQQGYTIDEAIMVEGGEPLIVMHLRVNNGFTWVPNASQQPLPTMPGADLPGLPAYDPLHPPAGSIIVSTNIADFPPFYPPAPSTPPALTTCPIGPLFSNWTIAIVPPGETAARELPVFSAAATDDNPEGFTITVLPAAISAAQTRNGVVPGKYIKHLLGTPMMDTSRRTGVWLQYAATPPAVPAAP